MKILLSLLFLSALIVGCSKQSELNKSMEEMGSAYKPMTKADSLAVIEGQIAEFKSALDTAAMQQVKPEDQTEFDEGMKQLESELAELQTAVAEQDLAAAQAVVKKMGKSRKKYHDLLGVKKKK